MSSPLYELPINNIIQTSLNCRTVLDRNNIENLKRQLSTGYTLPPITCRPSRIQHNMYEVVQGQHRLEASRQLGYQKIVSYIYDMSDKDVLLNSLYENVNRKNLSDLELWENSYRLYCEGFKPKEIAGILNVSETKARDNIRFYYFLSDEIKQLAGTDELKINMALCLCKINKNYQVNAYQYLKQFNSDSIVSGYKNYIQSYPGAASSYKLKDVIKLQPQTHQQTQQPQPQPPAVNQNPFRQPKLDIIDINNGKTIIFDNKSVFLNNDEIRVLCRQLASVANSYSGLSNFYNLFLQDLKSV